MSWDVRLWCNQEGCRKVIGVVNDVATSGIVLGGEPQGITLATVRRVMREHEVEVHGGKA